MVTVKVNGRIQQFADMFVMLVTNSFAYTNSPGPIALRAIHGAL
jgi:hypothetical protein